MRLRKLAEKDAPLMLEWMHDDTIIEYLNPKFKDKTIDECISFINASLQSEKDLHLAIVNDADEYRGTVSLKHIDKESSDAEFAITVRRCAQGTGAAQYGMKEIIRLGLEEIGLRQIIWCVSPKNKRAVRFYDRLGYSEFKEVPKRFNDFYSPSLEDLIWYATH